MNQVPAYSQGPERTVVKFRARQSTQDVPFSILSAFKYHIENISKIGKYLTSIRKSQAWIEEQESKIHRLSNIFLWTGGLVVYMKCLFNLIAYFQTNKSLALANEIRMQHESIQSTIKYMERLGSISYRVPYDDNDNLKPSLFKAKAIVTINKPEVIDHLTIRLICDDCSPQIGIIKETNQEVPAIFFEPSFSGTEERLCEKVQNDLDAFKANCLTRVCNILLLKLRNKPIVPSSRRPLHFPRRVTAPEPLDKRITTMPPNLQSSLIDWIERFGKDRMSWEPVDQFWQWYQSTEGKNSNHGGFRYYRICPTRLAFYGVFSTMLCYKFFINLQALFQMENCSPTEFYEESGYNDTEPISQRSLSNGLRRYEANPSTYILLSRRC
ncbi:unnamed protein product [Rodentolepis nana]|uniref:Uncharacterized protein n=1 Tax=Rodentolepis nana TaxID=102285 RepID=A0A3P7V4A3_RODNA|nr:unnamed protein product [Rodentolepis nana]